ncbi:MAG: AraC family transcriptional regulator [Planctomycetota bacterium]|nr:AraC family transcriptional regulator [Planctomycetota bacterium]
MPEELIDLLSNVCLPALEQVGRGQLVIPGEHGKKSFGPYPPDPNSPAVGEGLDLNHKSVRNYVAHPQNVEWVFAHTGKAELALDGRRYELSAGEMAVIPQHALHLERIRHPAQGYHLIWFCGYLKNNWVGIHSSSYHGGNRFQLVRGANFPHRPDLCRLFKRSAEEARERRRGWEALLRATFIETLVRCVRHLEDEGHAFTSDENRDSVVNLAKNYIQAHFAEPITLKKIAASVYLSPNYFSALFAKTVGATVSQYLQEVRLTEAKTLLAESKLPVHEVARQSGFATVHNFSRIFKKRTGTAPLAFRKRARPKS